MPRSTEVMGVPLERLQDPIRTAITTYQEISNNGIMFDLENVGRLSSTPEKTTSARSETDLLFNTNFIGKLYLIAFKPGDGSGSEVDFKLNELNVDPTYQRVIQVIPRKKIGVHSETHLAVVSHKIEDVHAEPVLFGGEFDLLGLQDNTVRKIGTLGDTKRPIIPQPKATYTVGYADSKRFGDPHAVYSSIPESLQICAFFALSDEIEKIYGNILKGLNPQLPFTKR